MITGPHNFLNGVPNQPLLKNPAELLKKQGQITPSRPAGQLNGLSGSVTDLYQRITGTNSGHALTHVSLLESADSLASDATTTPASKLYKPSKHHDDTKFIPNYSMMAYHESGSYRTRNDPYAVGAITNPTKKGDLGGKTYGTYQFESFVHPNGSKGKHVDNSTLMRFLRSSNNAYGPHLLAVAKKDGIASAAFDRAWKKLATTQNKAFGLAQQRFLMEDKLAKANAFFDRAGVSEQARKDPELFDMVLGTANHIGTLIDGVADHVRQLQARKGSKMTANEIGVAIAERKLSRVTSMFKSSPDAWKGLRNRFRAERAVFQ